MQKKASERTETPPGGSGYLNNVGSGHKTRVRSLWATWVNFLGELTKSQRGAKSRSQRHFLRADSREARTRLWTLGRSFTCSSAHLRQSGMSEDGGKGEE